MISLILSLCSLLPATSAFDLGQSTRCVAIPAEMNTCRDVGYTEMRLPNFLGHSSLEAEVIPKSQEWVPLLQTGCHPHARTFLCSLLAPVCLDTFIQPCRSLCVAVRERCAPLLACQGHAWPEDLDCDRFPAQEDMCLSPVSKEAEFFYKVLPRPTCQDCPEVEEPLAHKRVLEAFCQNNFAVKVKVHRRRMPADELEFEIEGRVEFISQGHLLPYDTRNLLQQWLFVNEACAQRLTRGGRTLVYVLAGDVRNGVVAVNRIFPWHRRDTQLSVAVRKWKHHKC
ncbi:sizzled [Erpetoichthys calabaricus]|uniref:Sizzled n=1 Tax=Erpetoichthys calabaricus TaxID=27687 RepID=A0A8C4RHI9_ERPCA|nr:sizzled [Erpetoichthys calabaricus]